MSTHMYSMRHNCGQLSYSVAVQLCWDKIKPTLVTKLGQGSFGQVYEGWYHSAPMAVKIINVDRCTGELYAIIATLTLGVV